MVRGAVAWLVALTVVAAAHVAVSLDAVAPVQTKDEIGYLAAARWLATGQGAGLITPEYAGGYAVGWGLLSAPLWWLTSHPPTVYAASIALDVVLAVALVVPASALARRLGVGRGPSLLLATALCLAAGRLGYTGYALPEGLLTLQLTTTAWLLLRLPSQPRPQPRSTARSGSPWATLAGLALLLAWLPTTHARFAPLAALGLLVLAGWAWTARSGAGVLAVAVGSAGAAAGWWLNGHVEEVLYGDVARTAVAAEQAGSLRPGDVLALMVGHAWYAAVAWLGLAVLGWLALLGPARRELAARRPGASTWLAVGAVGQLGVGAAYLSTRLDQGGRVDQLVYGRYGDPLWFVLAVVGGAALLARPSPTRVLLGAFGATAALSMAALVVLRTTGERVAGFVQLNVPGLEAWAWRQGDRFVVPWLPATLLALLVLGLLLLLAGRTRRGSPARTVAVVLVAAVLLPAALVAEQRNIQPRDAYIRQMFAVRGVVDAYPDGKVLLVVDRPLLLSGNALQWWLADRDPVVLGEGGPVPAGAPDGTLVVGPVAAPPAAPGALRLLGTDPSTLYAVWELDR